MGVCWEGQGYCGQAGVRVAFTLTGLVLEKGIKPSLGNIVCPQKAFCHRNDRGEEKWPFDWEKPALMTLARGRNNDGSSGL